MATAGEDVAVRFQRHPVIFLTFKDVKNKTWETCRANVLALLRSEVLRHRPTWSAVALADDDLQVLELKVADPNRETWETALDSAMRQIHDRAYATALHEAGADPVWLWAAVFDGKRVRVKVERGWLGRSR